GTWLGRAARHGRWGARGRRRYDDRHATRSAHHPAARATGWPANDDRRSNRRPRHRAPIAHRTAPPAVALGARGRAPRRWDRRGAEPRRLTQGGPQAVSYAMARGLGATGDPGRPDGTDIGECTKHPNPDVCIGYELSCPDASDCCTPSTWYNWVYA